MHDTQDLFFLLRLRSRWCLCITDRLRFETTRPTYSPSRTTAHPVRSFVSHPGSIPKGSSGSVPSARTQSIHPAIAPNDQESPQVPLRAEPPRSRVLVRGAMRHHFFNPPPKSGVSASRQTRSYRIPSRLRFGAWDAFSVVSGNSSFDADWLVKHMKSPIRALGKSSSQSEPLVKDLQQLAEVVVDPPKMPNQLQSSVSLSHAMQHFDDTMAQTVFLFYFPFVRPGSMPSRKEARTSYLLSKRSQVRSEPDGPRPSSSTSPPLKKTSAAIDGSSEATFKNKTFLGPRSL